MSSTYLKILYPLNNREPKFGHAYINKLNRIAVRKIHKEVKRDLKKAGVVNV